MFCAPYFGWFLGYDYNIHLAGLLAMLHIIWALNKRVRRSIKLLQHILLFFTAELDLFFYYINLIIFLQGWLVRGKECQVFLAKRMAPTVGIFRHRLLVVICYKSSMTSLIIKMDFI